MVKILGTRAPDVLKGGKWNGVDRGADPIKQDLARIAPHISVFGSDGYGALKFQIAGSSFETLFGEGLAGSDFHALWNWEDWHLLMDVVAQANQDRVPVSLLAETTFSGAGVGQFEMMLLPFYGGEKSSGLMLAVLAILESNHAGRKMCDPARLLSARFTDDKFQGTGATLHSFPVLRR